MFSADVRYRTADGKWRTWTTLPGYYPDRVRAWDGIKALMPPQVARTWTEAELYIVSFEYGLVTGTSLESRRLVANHYCTTDCGGVDYS